MVSYTLLTYTLDTRDPIGSKKRQPHQIEQLSQSFKLVASAILRTEIVALYVRTMCPHHGWVYDPYEHKDDIHCWICRLPNQV